MAIQPLADTDKTDTEPDNQSDSLAEEDNLSSSEEKSGHSLLENIASSGQDSASGSRKKGNDKYVIPMCRKPEQTGALPRRRSSSEHSSSDEGTYSPRPVRTRRPPAWMRNKDWMVGQVHTLTVNPDEVVYL